MGAVPFSDTVKIARAAVDMWDLLQRKRDGVKASTKKIPRLMHVTGIMTAFREPLPSIVAKRKEAMSKYNKIKKNAAALRENFGKD
jgi:hypothetical protein